jgi:hypothetical protein
MKELDPLVFLAVFHEMLGFWLWVFALIGILSVAGFVRVLTREGGIVSRRLVHSELWGLLGGAIALVIMAKASSSGFTDAGGPADWFLICLVYGAGFVASVVIVYTVLGLLRPRAS